MSPLMNASEQEIRQTLSEYLLAIEEHLERVLQRQDLSKNLLDACRYAVLGEGKRLRPLLSLLCCEAVGGNWRDALPAACSTEFIHAFSLVHDDLPAMDNDELRRGKPTLWKKYGEAMAILAGDALQALAFELACDSSYSGPVASQLLRELTDATTRMIVGQVYDTLGGLNPADSPADRLTTIHKNKTGALITAACCMGAIVAEADNDAIGHVRTFGQSIGLTFQIVDDLLDVEQSAEHIGKATGKDIEAGKMTFPGVLGVNASRDEIARLQEQAHMCLMRLGAADSPLAELCDYLAIRTK